MEKMFSRDALKKLIVPLILEQVLVVLIGMADTVMVASCGEAAVSGVSLVDAIAVLLTAIFSALATGGAVVASQYLGKKEPENAGRAAKQLFYVMLLISVSFMALGICFHAPLLSMIYGSIESSVMDAAKIYFLITSLSFPFLAMYNAACALLRSMGRSQHTLTASTAMNLVNIAGNAFFIYVLKIGVAGAATATLIARGIGMVMTMRSIQQPDCEIPYMPLRRFVWQGSMIRLILSVGVPNGFENGLFQLGKLVLVRMIATFGTASIAANAVGNSIGTFHVLPGAAICLAMITVVGQCCGAHEFEQARYYTKLLMKLSYITVGILNIGILIANPWITKPYNLSPEADLMARQIIAIHGVGSILIWPMAFVFPNALRAAGDAKFTMLVSSFSMIMFRVVFGYLMGTVWGMGVLGVWWAMNIDWVFRIALFVWRYRSGKWETKALV